MASRDLAPSTPAARKEALPQAVVAPAEARSWAPRVSALPSNVDIATGFAAFMAWTGMVGWIWNVRGIAVSARDDLAALIDLREREKVAYNLRLEKAEQAATSLDRLADAVKYGSERTASQISVLTDKLSEHATLTKEKFAEIQAEQKTVRQALSAGAVKARRES